MGSVTFDPPGSIEPGGALSNPTPAFPLSRRHRTAAPGAGPLRIRDAADPRLAQGARRRLAPGPARADARDRAGGDAADVRHPGSERTVHRLRHVRSVHRSGRAHRPRCRPAAAARGMDPRARRRRAPAQPEQRLRARPRRRREARRRALPGAASAAAREGRRERHADALRAAWPGDAGNGVHRDPREPAAGGDPRGAPAAAASGRGVRREPAEADHAGVRAPVAARSSRPTSTIPNSSR